MHIKRLYRKVLAAFALFSVELLLVWGVFIFSLFIFLFVWHRVLFLGIEDVDHKIFMYVDRIMSPQLTELMLFITMFGNWPTLLLSSCIIIVYFLFVVKHPWYSIKVPVVALGSISLNVVLKFLFNRPRPVLPHFVEATGLSFPSGHAMVSFSFYGLLLYLCWIKIEHKALRYGICTTLLLLIHLIGLSRIYLRVHYASDVIAGFAIGALWLIISIFFLKRFEKYTAKKIAPEV